MFGREGGVGCSLSLSRDGWPPAGGGVGPSRRWVGWLVVVGLVAGVLAMSSQSRWWRQSMGSGAEGAPELWCSSSQRVALFDSGSEWDGAAVGDGVGACGGDVVDHQEGSAKATVGGAHTWVQFDSR